MVSEQELKPGFCCSLHTAIFNSSFDSDDERPQHPSKRSGKLSFLPEIPFDVKHHLVLVRNKHDSASQCDDDGVRSLTEWAGVEVKPGDDCVGAKVPRKYTKTCHLAEYIQPKLTSVSLWNQFPEVAMCDSHPVECPYCGQRFSSGQALGGHTSRRHSSKRPCRAPGFKLRPKRQRLLSITEI